MARDIPEHLKGLAGKQRLWLKAYLNSSNPDTYLNAAGSARAAKYNCKDNKSFAEVGAQNKRKLKIRIDVWLDDEGLTEQALKLKLLGLMDAKETRIITVKGKLTEDELPPYCSIIANTTQTKLAGKDAEEYQEEHTILAIDLEALEIQRRSLDMGIKVKGLYAPDELHITGIEELGKRLTKAHKRVDDGSSSSE